jgi:peptide/nickel transport system permease protein
MRNSAVAGRLPADPKWLQSPKQRNLWLDALSRLARNYLALFGMSIGIMLVLVAVFGPMISPHGLNDQDLLRVNTPPSAENWLGTDQLGRDFLTRLVYAARTALIVAIVVTVVSTVIGVLAGSLAAYAGGWIDLVVTRIIDILMAVPYILLAIFINATIKPPVAKVAEAVYQVVHWELLRSPLVLDYLVVFVALGAVSWAGTARLIRGQILSIREQEYVIGARAIGARPRTILLSHLIPNALGPVIVAVSLKFGNAVMLEATLSYLGIGIQPPAASWGAMINENLSMWRFKPYLVVAPAVALAIVMFGFSALGDGINDALNPRTRR